MADYDKKIDDNDKMTLELDDGTTLVCDVIAIFSALENDYIALLPEDADEDAEIYLYRFFAKDDDFENVALELIEDDDEFDAVAKEFEDFMEKQSFLDEDDLQ